MVAGPAGANRDDGTGMLGTAPDTELIPLRVGSWDEFNYDCDGDGTVEEGAAAPSLLLGDILVAIDYASRIGVDAMNLSLGTLPLPPQANQTGLRVAYERVIARATQRGSVVVVATGNSSANLQQGGFFSPPSSNAGAMSVSATGPNDLKTFYSISETVGADPIDGVLITPLAATTGLLAAAAFTAFGVYSGYPVPAAFATTGAMVSHVDQ